MGASGRCLETRATAYLHAGDGVCAARPGQDAASSGSRGEGLMQAPEARAACWAGPCTGCRGLHGVLTALCFRRGRRCARGHEKIATFELILDTDM